MEHDWKNIYDGSGVEECANCRMQRRPESGPASNSTWWQFRMSASALTSWECTNTGALPSCNGADGQQTEELEAELKRCSEMIENHQFRFHRVREELKRRREAGDEQPVPLTKEQQAMRNTELQAKLDNNLILKITAMETEQAKLVIEAETAKAAQREAESRLALVVKLYVERDLKDATAAMDAVIAAEAAVRSPVSHDVLDKIAAQAPTERVTLDARINAAVAKTERVVLEEVARHHRSMSDYIADPGEVAGDKISKK